MWMIFMFFMANGTDFVDFSDEEEERVIVYGSVRDSLPIQPDKLPHSPRTERLSSISLQHDEPDERDNTSLIQSQCSVRVQEDNVSRTSDQASLTFVNPAIVTTKTYDNSTPWICQRYCQEKCRVAFASIGLVLLGIALLATGIVIWASTFDVLQAIVFLVIGIILIIPGGYHLTYVYCVPCDRTTKYGYSLL